MPDLTDRPHPHAAAIAQSLTAARRLLDAIEALETEAAFTYAGRPAYPGSLARAEQAYRSARHQHNSESRAALIEARAACSTFYG